MREPGLLPVHASIDGRVVHAVLLPPGPIPIAINVRCEPGPLSKEQADRIRAALARRFSLRPFW